MSSDYKLPDGYVNPVPEPGEKKPKPWAGKSMPGSGAFSAKQVGRFLAGVVVVLLVFSDAIYDVAGEQIRDAADAAQEWAGAEGLFAVDGEIKLKDSSVTAKYTPGANESTTNDEYNGAGFTGSQWALTQGSESIVLRDYNFYRSPVENRDVTASYYAESAKEANKRAGHEVDIDPIRVDGRRGMVWRSPVDGGGWLLLAEFPGDPSTVRLTCSAESETTVVASQCEEVLSSLQFGE